MGCQIYQYKGFTGSCENHQKILFLPVIFYRCNIFLPTGDLDFDSNLTYGGTVVTFKIGMADKFVTSLQCTGVYILLHPSYCGS